EPDALRATPASPRLTPSCGDPSIPAVARGGPVLEIRHLHPAEIVLGDLVAFGVHVDAEDPRGVQPEDLLLHGASQGRVPVPFDQPSGDLEAPKRPDLPLRRPIPDRIGSPEHVRGAEGVAELTEQVRAGGATGRDDLPER